MPPTDSEIRMAAGRDRPKAPVTPGVIFGFGVFIAAFGSVLLYLGAASDKHDDGLRSFLVVLQYATWLIGGFLILVAGIGWGVAVGIRSARDDWARTE